MSISVIFLAVFSHLIISQEENNTIFKSNSSVSISSSGSWEEIIFEKNIEREYYDDKFELIDITEQELDKILSEKIILAAKLAESDNFSDDEDSDEDDN